MKLYCLSLQKSERTSFSQKHLFYTLCQDTATFFFYKFQIDCGFAADLLSVLKKRVCTMSEKDIIVCNVCVY